MWRWSPKVFCKRDQVLFSNGLDKLKPNAIIVKGQSVSFTMFDPNMGIQDIPENYVNLTYELIKLEKGALLKIKQGDFSGAENAEKRYQESEAGWEMVIPLMKDIID